MAISGSQSRQFLVPPLQRIQFLVLKAGNFLFPPFEGGLGGISYYRIWRQLNTTSPPVQAWKPRAWKPRAWKPRAWKPRAWKPRAWKPSPYGNASGYRCRTYIRLTRFKMSLTVSASGDFRRCKIAKDCCK